MAVLAERLAVIGGDDDDRCAPRSALGERAEDLAEHLVGSGQGPIVDRVALGIAARVGAARGPAVGLEDVHPQQQRRVAAAALALVEPGARGVGQGRAMGLDREVGEAALEPGVDRSPEALAAHEACGVVAAGAHPLGEHDVAGVEAQRPANDAAAHAIGRQAGDDRRDRSTGDVARRQRAVEHRSAHGERGERGHRGLAAVGRRVIGAHGVDRDQEDVGVRGAGALDRAKLAERDPVADRVEVEHRIDRQAGDGAVAPDLEGQRRPEPCRDQRGGGRRRDQARADQAGGGAHAAEPGPGGMHGKCGDERRCRRVQRCGVDRPDARRDLDPPGGGERREARGQRRADEDSRPQ
jgi:hypothetical protein